MADVIVSKIQHRRGLKTDLPQPLDPGELGYTTDTRQLYIGDEPFDEEQLALRSLSIVMYRQANGSQSDANRYITSDVAPCVRQFDLGICTDDDDAYLKLEQATTVLKTTGQLRVVPYHEPEEGSGGYNYRGYVGYYEGDSYAINGVSIAEASGYTFEQNSLDLQLSRTGPPEADYVLGDSYAIAELINAVHVGTSETLDPENSGLVTVNQNVEVLTEYSDLNSLLFQRTIETFPYPGETPGAPVLLGTFEYDVADSLEVEYTISTYPVNADTGEQTGAIEYRRKGRLRILVHKDENKDQADALTYDDYTELSSNAVYSIDITASVIPDTNTVEVIVTPQNFGEYINIVFKTLTAEWSTFE